MKFLYTIKETKIALARGTTSVYKLINEGRLDAVKFGRQTYIKAPSIEALLDALEPIQTPTMKAALEAQAERDTSQPLEAKQSARGGKSRGRFPFAAPRAAPMAKAGPSGGSVAPQSHRSRLGSFDAT